MSAIQSIGRCEGLTEGSRLADSTSGKGTQGKVSLVGPGMSVGGVGDQASDADGIGPIRPDSR